MWKGVSCLTFARMCILPQLQDTFNHFQSNVICFIYCSSISDKYVNQRWNCWKVDCSCFLTVICLFPSLMWIIGLCCTVLILYFIDVCSKNQVELYLAPTGKKWHAKEWRWRPQMAWNGISGNSEEELCLMLGLCRFLLWCMLLFLLARNEVKHYILSDTACYITVRICDIVN